ncbi:hypothetical protein HY496_01515 [Candidatus Woesearchaeota archaeon]|nr:hypothetical protein [Candidatus Woesearchaeota archaeon]
MKRYHRPKQERERDVQNVIKTYLELKQFLVVKYPSVGIYKRDTGSYIPLQRRGVSDLLACSPIGEFVAIEVKTGYNKPTNEQAQFLEDVNKKGGIGFTAYSLEDVIDKLFYASTIKYKRHKNRTQAIETKKNDTPDAVGTKLGVG